jgi:hypothetical protein
MRNVSQKLPGRSDDKIDAASNVVLNGVTLPDGTVVPWAVAFPR